MRTLFHLAAAGPALAVLAGCAGGAWIDEARVVDLTYPFNAETVYWPTANPFRLKAVAAGFNDAGEWYAANEFSAAEHGGTHLDAPIHFAPERRDAASIPLARFIAPARVIDVRGRCEQDRDYQLTVEDIRLHERRWGRIEPGDAVLVRTGFGAFYPDLERYLGSAVRGRVEGLHFPGIGEAAALLLAERGADIVGIDTASLDHGPSTAFLAHRILSRADIPGLENIANLDRLPPRGALLIALPMKIEGGTGGPCRIIAVLP